MDKSYIAGFFDAEGSAMILTIHRQLKTGIIYRFRPVIKIAQKTDAILELIKGYIGDGHIDRERTTNSYIINGLGSVVAFVRLIAPYCFLKQEVLLVVGELAEFQLLRQRNIPYSLEDTIKMLDTRDKAFGFNKTTRTGLKQKYPRERILAETNFVSNIHQWQLKRGEAGLQAMIEKGKPYRFQKGANRAS